MTVGELGLNELMVIDGVKLDCCAAGIKKSNRKDLSLIEICEGASISAVFTKNAFCAAPVTVAKNNLASRSRTQKSYLLINSGNANAGTGQQGLADAHQCCELISKHFEVDVSQTLPFSTGVIGQPLPMQKIASGLKYIAENGIAGTWNDVANAILTTDTRVKIVSKQITISGKTLNITGIAKGSGMIKPDMATMLAYIACDASIENSLLDEMLKTAANQSFHCISVDGDTSTNDAFVLIATGKGDCVITKGSEDAKVFQKTLNELSILLAQLIIRDGEGASKFIEIHVEGGSSEQECKEVAYTIAHSPLVKTAFFASDPNWGRILAALGRAPIDNLDISKVDIMLGDVQLITKGELASDYTEEKGQTVMNKEDITVSIQLNRGEFQSKVWTCDFSYDYVKINAEYRS
jgi:glutamate N-acetyltransferase/amino-acid N-acetyltransferase